jgi:hypothetical protein
LDEARKELRKQGKNSQAERAILAFREQWNRKLA